MACAEGVAFPRQDVWTQFTRCESTHHLDSEGVRPCCLPVVPRKVRSDDVQYIRGHLLAAILPGAQNPGMRHAAQALWHVDGDAWLWGPICNELWLPVGAIYLAELTHAFVDGWS